MAKKAHKLHEGGLTDLNALNTRYHDDSTTKRRDKWEEEETGVKKVRKRWKPEDDDLVLDLSEKGRIDSMKYDKSEKAIRGRRVRVQHLASRTREYVGTPARLRSRWYKPWSKWDDKIVKMATTYVAFRNGAADAEYIARLLARSVDEVLEHVGGLLLRLKEQYKL